MPWHDMHPARRYVSCQGMTYWTPALDKARISPDMAMRCIGSIVQWELCRDSVNYVDIIYRRGFSCCVDFQKFDDCTVDTLLCRILVWQC